MNRSKPAKVLFLCVVVGVVAVVMAACGTNATREVIAGEQDTPALKKQLQDTLVMVSRAAWRIIPDAPPRAAPPPPAPGTTPPPAPRRPDAKFVPIAFYVDTVTAGPGESKYRVDASIGCARTGVFKRGMHVVWRMEAVDTSTGKVLQDSDVETAIVRLPNGETARLRYGRHGATDTAPWFWSAAWDIPMDYPLGDIDYTIVVTTKSGKTGTFNEMRIAPNPSRNVASAGLTVVN